MSNELSKLENKINSLFEQACTLLQREKYDDAEYYFKQILNLDQNYSDALHLLGILNYQTGHIDESLKYLNKAITVKPLNANYCNDIALVYDHIGMLDNANKFFKKAIQLEPDNPAYLFNIGNLLLNTGNEKDAVVYYKKAIKINNENAYVYNNLGQALHRLHDVDSAERAYREAIKINANFASAYNNLGILLQDRGDFNGAMDSYNEALRCDPDMVMACSNIAYLKKCNSSDDEIIYKLINLFEKDDIDIEDEIVISFALGKLYDDCSEYEKAFKNYERGNLLAGMDVDFDKDFYISVSDTIKNSFDFNFFNTFEFNGNSSEKPVFIVGMPRSGTSLVEQIISSHSKAAGVGELDYFNQLSGINKNNQELFKERQRVFLNQNELELSQIAEKYLDILVQYSNENYQYVVDKMPYNFFNLGLIAALFPNAHIIHCTRNPYDVCLSIYFQYFQGTHNYSFDLENIAFIYNIQSDLMEHWKKTINNPVLTVNYENIIENPGEKCREIISFLGLSWDQGCLDFHKSKRDVFTRSNVQVRQPIYKKSVSRWENYKPFIDPIKQIIE